MILTSHPPCTCIGSLSHSSFFSDRSSRIGKRLMEQILIGIPNKVRHVILPYMLNHLFHCFNVKGMFFPSQDVGGSKCSGPTGGHKGKLGVQVSVRKGGCT